MHLYLNLQGFCVSQSVIQLAYKFDIGVILQNAHLPYTFNPIRSL